MTDSDDAPNAGTIWVLADDRAGNRAQALGVADALDHPFRTLEVRYGPAARLPNAVLGASLIGMDAVSRAAIAPPWPDVVIAAGRRTAPIARSIKRRSAGKTKLVQIMDPAAGRSDFDVLAIPAHDAWDGHGAGDARVIRFAAAPHRMTPDVLAEAAETWRAVVNPLPAPRFAVIVGGSTRTRRFTDRMAADLGRRVRGWVQETGGSLLITTSRRTDADAAQALLAAVGDVPRHTHLWGTAGDNPYAGYLALADHVIVTGESVSMCSEALATAKPVSVYAPPGLIGEKHARLHAALFDGGHAHPLDAGRNVSAGPGVSTARTLADAVRTLFSQAGPTR